MENNMFKLYDIKPQKIFDFVKKRNDKYFENPKLDILKDILEDENKKSQYINNDGYFSDDFYLKYEKEKVEDVLNGMYELFECYVHAKFKELITKDNNYKKIEIGDYVADKLNLGNNFGSGYRQVIRDESNSYLSGPVIPDIVLKYNDKYFIYDVKCKDSRGSGNSRGDRLQLLAYQVMYEAAEIGHIFPFRREDEISARKKDDIISKNAKVNLVSEKQVCYYQYDVNIENIDRTIRDILDRLTSE